MFIFYFLDCFECYCLFYVEVKKFWVSLVVLVDIIDCLWNGYIGDVLFV